MTRVAQDPMLSLAERMNELVDRTLALQAQ